ncbi:hypothetical protein [Armatimonas rosea]|uniref:Uncharacterized protein n=1 Tax=Armatimonas rosea TaxID=685828 RepID=A0A7W9SQ30_ARMRO|nr:hypothetical protein [Armatimonas rosea]MBB6050767.1 hypothetical protein [Armatimonas rosea]
MALIAAPTILLHRPVAKAQTPWTGIQIVGYKAGTYGQVDSVYYRTYENGVDITSKYATKYPTHVCHCYYHSNKDSKKYDGVQPLSGRYDAGMKALRADFDVTTDRTATQMLVQTMVRDGKANSGGQWSQDNYPIPIPR